MRSRGCWKEEKWCSVLINVVVVSSVTNVNTVLILYLWCRRKEKKRKERRKTNKKRKHSFTFHSLRDWHDKSNKLLALFIKCFFSMFLWYATILKWTNDIAWRACVDPFPVTSKLRSVHTLLFFIFSLSFSLSIFSLFLLKHDPQAKRRS